MTKLTGRMLRWVPGSCLLVALLSATGAARAQCDCDHVISANTPSANGTDLGVAPGDSVCIEGGARDFLRLYDFVGSAGAPIVIRNCNGQVSIRNADRGYGLTVDGSKYFRITGTGDPAHTYGFRISATRTGPDYSASGVVVAGLSTNYELDHLEVYETGFAGFSLKTEPTCDGSANEGAFVQYDTRVHHSWVHDTGGEGFYVGSTGYGGRSYDCNGQSTTLYPHMHEGVYLHDNLVERTGWDGLQVGMARKDCEVFRNVIVDVGLAGEQYQQQGIQIGGPSACQVYGNVLRGGPANGVIILNAGETSVYNTLIVDFAGDGIYANDRGDAPATASYRFVNNTIVRPGGSGIGIFGSLATGNVAYNNLVVGAGDAAVSAGSEVDWDESNNLVDLALAEAGFLDAPAHDYRLEATSPAVNAGRDVTSYGVTADLDGVPRDGTPDVGAYEYTDQPRPDGGVGGGAGAPAGGGSTGSSAASAEDQGGCACHAPASSPVGSQWLLALAFGAAWRRRRVSRSASRRRATASAQIITG